jgi:hypothetical protein
VCREGGGYVQWLGRDGRVRRGVLASGRWVLGAGRRFQVSGAAKAGV